MAKKARQGHELSGDREALKKLDQEIDQLVRRRVELERAAAAKSERMFIDVVRRFDVARIAPDRLIAILEQLDRALASETTRIGSPFKKHPEGAPPASYDDIAPIDEVDIAVSFGNHNSTRVQQLRDAGLVRNGRDGVWRGRVDGTTFDTLKSAFPGKLAVTAIHRPDRNSTAAVDGSDDHNQPAPASLAIQAVAQSTVPSPEQASNAAVRPLATRPFPSAFRLSLPARPPATQVNSDESV